MINLKVTAKIAFSYIDDYGMPAQLVIFLSLRRVQTLFASLEGVARGFNDVFSSKALSGEANYADKEKRNHQ